MGKISAFPAQIWEVAITETIDVFPSPSAQYTDGLLQPDGDLDAIAEANRQRSS